MDRRIGGNPRPRPLDHGDPRTPIAWQHRNMNHHSERYGGVVSTEVEAVEPIMDELYLEALRNVQQPRSLSQHRPTSPSTSTSATSDSTGLGSDGHLPLRDFGGGRAPPLGTLRSLQSSLATWDGEPCPIHHPPLPPPLPPPMFPLLPPPAVLLPPMLRPRPLVLAATSTPLEPLPVRDPKTPIPLPPKDITVQSKHIHCCKGNIVVFWIILGIIFIGILLGVILRFVTA